MKKRRFKVLIFIFLVLGQIVIYKYRHQLKLNLDLLYLILVYISVKSGFLRCILTAAVIGLVTDYFSMNVLGVFGFSRTIAGFLLNEVSSRIDLRNNIFVFLLIAISLSLSNFIANIFFYFILGLNLDLSLILYQPALTGLVGTAIVISEKTKEDLNVY